MPTHEGFSDLCATLARLLAAHNWGVRRLREEAGFGTEAAVKLLDPSKGAPSLRAVERGYFLLGQRINYFVGEAEDAPTRICTKCGALLPIFEFLQRPVWDKRRDENGNHEMQSAYECRQCSAGDGQAARHNRRGQPNQQFPYRAWREKITAAGGKCVLCGKAGERLVIDHIKAFVDGGELVIENLRPVCYACNHPRAKTREGTEAWWCAQGL